MVIVAKDMSKLIFCGGKATIGDDPSEIFRPFSGCHEHGSRTHGNAMEQDLTV